jgi:hypothetical protein
MSLMFLCAVIGRARKEQGQPYVDKMLALQKAKLDARVAAEKEVSSQSSRFHNVLTDLRGAIVPFSPSMRRLKKTLVLFAGSRL